MGFETDRSIFGTTVATGEVTDSLEREIESLNVAVAAGILLERLRTG